MSKQAVFTMKIELELRELMHDYIGQRHQAKEYDKYLLAKVSIARASVEADVGRANEDVEALFAVKRKQAGLN